MKNKKLVLRLLFIDVFVFAVIKLWKTAMEWVQYNILLRFALAFFQWCSAKLDHKTRVIEITEKCSFILVCEEANFFLPFTPFS